LNCDACNLRRSFPRGAFYQPGIGVLERRPGLGWSLLTLVDGMTGYDLKAGARGRFSGELLVERSAALVPELLVTDIAASLRFWVDTCGFSVAYDRPDEGFAYLELGGAQVMLEEAGRGRNWITGALEAPFGRGINFQVEVPSLEPLLSALAASDYPLFMAPEEQWYRKESVELGVRQFLVQDPDGYLIRFQCLLGKRVAAGRRDSQAPLDPQV